MTRQTHVATAFAFGAGLMAAGAALAQTQSGSAAQPAASAQSAPPTAQSALPSTEATPPSAQFEMPSTKPWDRDQPTYSVNPPPEGPSGIYLPAVVLGYAKSAAGCVVIGCEDGPQVGGASAPPSSGSAAPPSANPWLSEPR